jgi:DNA-directed RNA polymerase subunit M/transcription elongation factor TFIIS
MKSCKDCGCIMDKVESSWGENGRCEACSDEYAANASAINLTIEMPDSPDNSLEP